MHVKSEIANYLQQGNEGKFYYRMVDTVLSRDKNWVYWKAEGCPPFQRPSVTALEYSAARNDAGKATTNKRLRPTPMGALDLKFLTETDGSDGMEKLKDPERYSVPPLESFEWPIAGDDFEMEMAKTDEERSLAFNARASKMWRTLRIASKGKFGLFDKLDDGGNLGILFRPPEEKVTTVESDERTATDGSADVKQEEAMEDGAKVVNGESAVEGLSQANADAAEGSTPKINGLEDADTLVAETTVK